MRWPVFLGVITAIAYTAGSLGIGRRRPDVRALLGCIMAAGIIQPSAAVLWAALCNDKDQLHALVAEVPWYTGTAALVVLYHSLEQLVDMMRRAWRKSVNGRTEPAAERDPTAPNKTDW